MSQGMKRDPYTIVKRPLVTEKGTTRNEIGQYLFEVDTRANKPDIRWAIEQIFKVKVTDVNTLILKPEVHKTQQRSRVHKRRKKAYVTLAQGQMIDVFALAGQG